EARTPAPAARTPRPDDLDQPRSTAQRDRLLAMLDDPSPQRRETAARALLDWPEPATRHVLLRAYLDGRIELPVPMSGVPGKGERLVRLAGHLDAVELEPLVPALLSAWEHGDRSAGDALRRVAPDIVADALSGRLADRAWGLLDLLAGRPLLRTPALERTVQHLRAEGRDDLAGKLILVDGPLRDPGAAADDEAALSALREHRPGTVREPSRAELLKRAREGDPKEIRRALTALAEAPPDGEFTGLLAELIVHRETKVRLHAHRVSRRVLDRAAYLAQTTRLLDDPEPGVVRSAVRTLSHASHEPAIPGLVTLLAHAHRLVREAAAEGLVLIGAPAIPALRHAASRARPDRRQRYIAVLRKITG
ncbi:HEAT repeat domain-containing protein, partial [Actinomadura rubrisoli]